MSENAAVKTFVEKARTLSRSHVQRVEDKYSIGVPDINVCVDGREVWLEAKFLPAWPARESTGVRVPLRPEQCLWSRSAASAGRNVRCLLRVPLHGWIVWDAASVAFDDLRTGIFNRERILEVAAWHGRVLDVRAVLGV